MFDKIKEDAREVLTGSTPENDLRARLHADHVDVDRMISELRSSGPGDRQGREKIRDQLMVALTAHARAEEEVVYDRLRTEPELGVPIREAFREHEDIELNLDELCRMEVDDARFIEVLDRLQSAVQSHVHDEENQVLPRAEALLGKDTLANLIPPFNTRQANLTQQLKGDRELSRTRRRSTTDPMGESHSQY